MSALSAKVLSTKTVELFERLNRAGVIYCHWKSNCLLQDSFLGKADFDLLIAKESRDPFESILAELGFRLAVCPPWDSHPSIQHYYGLDEGSGQIVHLHVYYELITGGALVKNYRLPLERMLFESVRYVENVPLPSKAAELLVFVLRKVSEHGSLVEHLLVRREYPNIEKELKWLRDAKSEAELMELLKTWLPSVDRKLFGEALEALGSGTSAFRLFMLGKRMRSSLRAYAIVSPVRATLVTYYRLAKRLYQRFLARKSPYALSSSGALIAFVGPEAAGKSTLLTQIARWLGEHFAVEVAHAGKPPTTWLTAVPSVFLPMMRNLLPESRTNVVEIEMAGATMRNWTKDRRHSLVYLLRSFMIAYDQNRLLVKARRKARKGSIVLCDRYPSTTLGGMDGPRVDPSWFGPRFSIKRLLAQMEQKLYSGIPKPDLVVLLRVPLEVALHRNAERADKKGTETEDYVRTRHALMERWCIPHAPTLTVDTDQPVEETLLTAKRSLWKAL